MYDTLLLDQFQQPDVLNIFCDASVMTTGVNFSRYIGCYGAIAVLHNRVIDSVYRIAEDTNNACELYGLMAAIDMAVHYKNDFRVINIFCDSEQAVKGIRDRVYNWKIRDGVMYTKQGSPVQSQNIYTEIVLTIMRYDLNINIFQQKGHVSGNGKSIAKADKVFIDSNDLDRKVDLNLIRWISQWNGIIDAETRNRLRSRDKSANYVNPLTFSAEEFDREHYSKLLDINDGYF